MRRALRIAAVTVSHRILKNVGVGYPAPYKVLPSSHQSWFSPEKTNFDGNLVRLCTPALAVCGGVVKVPVENFFVPRGENTFCPCPRQLGWMARVGGYETIRGACICSLDPRGMAGIAFFRRDFAS